ncbi:MAG TPA: ATP-dependent Clp protease proteolytic subunit [Candidatus Absconditabacterales bacterium]|nr:ATP-dependent Clp protease proteolytic subunit [Candidatus Absconditabacterales bacterium]HNG97147.1 ATP-dependent Clp protease proteolytic subunit [Candidatus Absconditabacterales bacterium]
MFIPTIIEKTPNGERARDIFSRLVEDRIIYFGSQVTAETASLIIAQLLFLNKKDPKKDIIMYINSPGGSIASGMAIYDTMQMIGNDVVTVCVGMAASMGSMLLAAGTKGKRFALPHSEIMIHQPLMSGLEGQASDIEIHAKHIISTKKRMNQTLSYHTGQSLKVIEKDTDRDNYMTAEEALKYGLIDKVIGAYDLWKEIGAIK